MTRSFLSKGGVQILLMGGDGDDRFYSAPGQHQLFGGAGDDYFRLGAENSATGGEGTDTFLLGPSTSDAPAEILDFDPSEDTLAVYQTDETHTPVWRFNPGQTELA